MRRTLIVVVLSYAGLHGCCAAEPWNGSQLRTRVSSTSRSCADDVRSAASEWARGLELSASVLHSSEDAVDLEVVVGNSNRRNFQGLRYFRVAYRFSHRPGYSIKIGTEAGHGIRPPQYAMWGSLDRAIFKAAACTQWQSP